MTIYDDYVNYSEKYRSKYGTRTLVLIEVGSFWELYDCNEGKGAPVKEVTDLLGIVLTKKNKAILEISKQNPLMAGFPTHALDKFLPILLEKYTVVLVSQITPPPNPKRDVTSILSKGTSIFDTEMNQSNNQNQLEYNQNIMCLYTRNYKDIRTKLNGIVWNFALADLSTGKCSLYTTTDYDDANVFINKIKPCEVLLVGDNHLENLTFNNALIFDHRGYNISEFLTTTYQEHILGKLYNNHFTNMLSVIENLGLAYYPDLSFTFAYLITYANDHNPILLRNFSTPDLLFNKHTLHMSQNTIESLDVDGLETIINRCATAPGRRFFKSRLYNPCINADQLIKSYNKIESQSDVDEKQKQLKECYDLERLFRKWNIGKLHPYEIIYISKTLEILENLGLENREINNCIQKDLLIDVCTRFKNNDIQQGIFKTNVFPEIDSLCDEVSKIDKELESMMERIDNNLNFKLEYTDRDGYFLTTTSKRFSTLNNKNNTLQLRNQMINLDELSLTKMQNGTYMKIKFGLLTKVSDEKNILINKLKVISAEFWQEWLKDSWILIEKHAKKAINFMIDVDFYSCCKRNALEFNYSKPIIISENDSNTKQSQHSFLGIRHPIIEQIQKNVKYVENDINSMKPIVLYGLNAAGKTSLMKSIGLNIIMAQAGMFVACQHLELIPYHKLFTRIGHIDDIYQGYSTFVCEMNELRNILKKSDQNSLVLGDELCCGTEHQSALAIVSSTINSLLSTKTNFIFTTHLHELELDESRINICHLHVESKDNLLIYDRKLRNGKGNPLYGLEVCKYLGFEEQFLTTAFKARDLNMTLGARSRYNQNVRKDICEICQKKANDIHHITEQHKNTYDKNFEYNLVSICKECHNKIHDNEIDVKGYIQTSLGVKLDHEHINKNQSEPNLTLLNDLLANKLPKSCILQELKKEDKSWTMYKLNKYLQK